jgi:MscS family membrane protein
MTLQSNKDNLLGSAASSNPGFWSFALAIGLVVSLASIAAPVSGQTPERTQLASSTAAQETTDPWGRTTPRSAITGFIRAAGRKDFISAAEYLQRSKKQDLHTEALARDLKELMDRYFNQPLSTISNSPTGSMGDALPLDRERVGYLRAAGQSVEILLVRVNDSQAGWIWLISSDTLAQIPSLHRGMEKTWIERLMPQMLLEYSFLEVPASQWIASIASIGIPLLFFWLLSHASMAIIRAIAKNPSKLGLVNSWYGGLSWPLILVLALIFHLFVLQYLGISLGVRIVYGRFVLVLLIAAFGWLLRRIVALSFARALRAMQRMGRIRTESLMLLGERLLQVAIVLVAVFSILTIAGIDATTALAGLGIGGVAIALGAQKTIENLLGGIFLLTDKAIAIGDLCCISSRVGTIEDITLRSIRLRTLEGTLLCIPAGVLSQENIENFSARSKILLQTPLHVRYGTTAEQLASAFEAMRDFLAHNPRIERDTFHIHLVDYGLSAIQLELFAYILTSDQSEFMVAREDLLLHLAALLESVGSGFARPTEFVYVESDTGRQNQIPGLNSTKTAGHVQYPERQRRP